MKGIAGQHGTSEDWASEDWTMELNTKGRYAVMALADLAKFGEGASQPLSAIAERQQISLTYLEQIFGKLRRAGLVESVRGRGGGYLLSRQPEDIAISEIMRAVGEPVRMTRCPADQPGGCIGDERCLTHDLWRALGDHILGFLEETSLADVLAGSIQGKGLSPTADFGLAAE